MVDKPQTIDLIAPNTFQMTFKRIPETIYHIQRIDFPGVSMGTVLVPTGPITNHDFFVPGEKLTFDPLNMGILLDENLDSYVELLNWMKECTTSPGIGRKVGELKAMTDATLILQTNKFNSNKRVIFEHIFPTQISGFSFDYQTDPMTPITVDCTFQYRFYRIENV